MSELNPIARQVKDMHCCFSREDKQMTDVKIVFVLFFGVMRMEATVRCHTSRT